MSDKELDKLFHSEFESFEVEPSAGLWNKIDAELGAAPGRQKKKMFPIFWMAAASVVLVIAAGFYFMQPHETVKLRGKENNQIAKNKPVVKDEQPVKIIEQAVVTAIPVKQPIANKPANRALAAKIYKAVKIDPEPVDKSGELEPLTNADDKNVNISRALTANSALVNNTVDNTTQPGMTNPVNTIRPMSKSAAIAMLNDQQKHPDNQSEQESAKRKIRSLGDLVNRVVAKVDPREDKIIEFTESDEGSAVSGINIGILKIKSKTNNTHR